MYLRKQGPGAVTAADIAPPAGVEVHNPDLNIATLNGKGKLEIELTVERGRGYVSAVQNKQPGQEIGRIPVDSIYSPVLKVTYEVEATRVEQRTDFDRLVVDVETKSLDDARATPSPRAGHTLVELFGLARELNVEAEGIDDRPVAGRRAARGRPRAADRGARPHGPLLQLPQARGHPHGGRARRAQRGRPARHPQLRVRSRSTRSRSSWPAWAWRSRTARPDSTRRSVDRRRTTRTTTTTGDADFAETEQLLTPDRTRPADRTGTRGARRCLRPPRAPASAAAPRTSG